MKDIYLVNGFSDIKNQLISKCKLTKPASEITLWFSKRDNEVYAHDKDNHSTNIIIALKCRYGWRYYLDAGSMGEMTLIHYVGELTAQNNSLANKLNERYDLLGYFSFRRR